MGQTKLEKAGNYFVATDIDSGDLAFEPQPTKDIRYVLEKETVKFFDKDQKRYGANDGYLVGLTGTVDLTAGASGSVDGISVDSVEIMSGAKATAVMSSVAANTFASGTVTCATVLATRFATGTVTCATVMENTFASGTAQCTTVVADETVTINGLLYTAVAGSKAGDFTKFSVDTGDDECAADLADSVNNDVRSGTIGIVSATSSTDTVTLTTDVLGVGGNATTLAETGTTITISGAVFTGGVDADFTTINGLVYTAISGSKGGDFTKFSTDTSDDATATDLADSITNDVRSGTLGDLIAVSITDTVTMTSDETGTDGNAVTLTSSDGGTLAVSGATFTGGIDAGGIKITVNALVYTAVDGAKTDFTEFSVDGNNDATATSLAHSITNDTRSGTAGDLVVNAATNVVTMVTDETGTDGNAITLVTSESSTLAISGATFAGGVAAETITVNGLAYTAVTGTPADFTQFSIDTGDDETATSLAAAITGDARSGTLNDVTAIAVTDTVTMTQTVGGAGGKATTLVETGAGITISGATFDAPQDFDTSLTVTATKVAANITAHTSIPNYSATSNVGLITIKIETDKVAVNGFTVASEVTTISSTDVNMGVDTGNLIDSAGSEFVDLATLIIFLRANTGA